MVKDRALDGFRTPGGHLRVTAESIEAAKNHEAQPARAREASLLLRSRRERIEELTLEAQELRAKRELGKLRGEEQEETERREAEAQAREEEAEQRRAEIGLERERLEREKAEDRRRRQREQAQKQAQLETDQDAARVRRECVEILAELPIGLSEAEAREALEATVREACREIQRRKAEQGRQARKANLMQQGVAEVVTHMAKLERQGKLTREEYWDSNLTDHLQTTVRRFLESELTGEESAKKATDLAYEAKR